jgi:TonB-dependent receptor
MKKSVCIYAIVLFSCFPLLQFSQNQVNGNINGTVIDSFGVMPGVLVSIDTLKLSTFTNSNGEFNFFKVKTGQYTLTINALGYHKKQVTVTVMPNATERLKPLTLISNNTFDEVVINSKMESNQARSINQTRNSLKIVTILSADEINKLPTKNAADIASRLPSIAVQRNNGENSTVSLRGTPTDWSAVLINGDRLPVACEDNTTRSFEFEAFPSDLVDEVIEARSISPDMESDNIGGSINFFTRPAPFERVLEIDAAAGYNFLAKKPIRNFKIMYGDVTKNKKISFIVNGSYYTRNYSTNASRVIYGNNTNHSVDKLELRRYDGLRTTIGGNVSIEYRLSSKIKIGSHSFIGNMTDEKFMKKQSFNWIDDSGRRIRLQNTYGLLDRRIFGGDIFTEINPTKRLKINAKIAMYDNEFKYGPSPTKKKGDPRNGFVVTEFMSQPINFTDYSIVDLMGNPIDAASPDAIYIKLIGTDEPYGLGDSPNNIQPHFTNTITPQNMDYNGSYTEINNTHERDALVAQLDAEYQLNNKFKLQIGGKFRNKVGYRHISKHEWLQDYTLPGNSTAITLADLETTNFTNDPADFLKEQQADYQNFMYPFLTNEASVNFISNHQSQLREIYMDKYNSEYKQWVGSSYDYTENQTAGYAMLTFSSKKIATLIGVRIENTILHQSSDTLTDNIFFDPVTYVSYKIPEKRYTNRNYTGVLPSLNFVYSLNPNSIIRFASSQTMHRPNFEETKPGASVLRYNELKNTAGNPNLKPVFSFNIDLSYDFYWGSKGMFSIGGYYKKIKDHIFTVSTSQTDASGITLKTFANAPDSWVGGIELLLNRKFTFLKGAWSGLGINSNVTYSFSRMKVPGRPKAQQMTEQTPLLYSIALYYEYKKIDTRFALLYNGSYLSELNLTSINNAELLHKDSDYDTFIGEYYSLDYEFSYQITKRLSAYLELNNLLNAAEKKYRGQTWRTISSEYYRMKGQIGIRFEL